MNSSSSKMEFQGIETGKGKDNQREIETQVEDEISKEDENRNQIVVAQIEKEERLEEFNIHGDCRRNLPPVDDVCPICFDKFTVPCRTNCGHWYCASCIMEFWAFKSSIRPCKCPLCSCRITNLVPVISRLIGPEDDATMVIHKVRQYNRLHIGGVCGIFLKVLALPIVIRKIFRVMMDPPHFRFIYYLLRFIGILLPLLYEIGEFEFIPTGGLGIHRVFDVGTNMLVLCFLIVSIWRKWAARGRTWRSAILRAWRA